MTVLEELEQKIVEAEVDVQRVLAKLAGLAELEGALGETNRTLLTAGAGLSRLADSLDQITEDIKQALAAFREAAHTIRETDPALLLQTVSRVEARVESTHALITDAAQKLDRIQPDMRETLDSLLERLKEAYAAEAARHEALLAANTSRVSTARNIAIFGVILGLVIIGLNIYKLFGH